MSKILRKIVAFFFNRGLILISITTANQLLERTKSKDHIGLLYRDDQTKRCTIYASIDECFAPFEKKRGRRTCHATRARKGKRKARSRCRYRTEMRNDSRMVWPTRRRIRMSNEEGTHPMITYVRWWIVCSITGDYMQKEVRKILCVVRFPGSRIKLPICITRLQLS